MDVSYYHPAVERLSRLELEALQERRLTVLLEQLAGTEPARAKQLGSSLRSVGARGALRRLPVQRKEDIVAEQAGWDTGPSGPVGRANWHRAYLTSGTTGKGQELWLAGHRDRFGGSWARALHMMGLRRGQTVLNLFPVSVGTLASPDTQVPAFDMLGVRYIHAGMNYTTEEKLKLALRFQPQFVMGLGSTMIRLMEVAKQAGIEPLTDLPGLQTIPGDFQHPWLNEGLEEFYNARTYDFWGCSATRSAVASSCEFGTRFKDGRYAMLHLPEDLIYYEVCDPQTGRQVGYGEPGELLATTLTMSQMPAVRFATGDKVVRYPADYCACGRPFSGLLIGGTERYDDMMKIRGVNVWPSAVDAVVLANSAVAEYAARIFVDGAGREVLILGLQPSDDASPEKKDALERAVADAVREVTGLRAEVHIVETDLVGALSDFKVKRWVDLRSKGVGLSLADAIDDLAERKTRY